MPKLPYTDFHALNQDWIIKTIKKMFSPDNPPPYPVESVNGQTGDVVLTGEDINISEQNQTSIKAFCDALLLAIQQKYTLPSTGLPWNDLAQAVKDIINGKYNLPSSGIPWDDLSSGVKNNINSKYTLPANGIPMSQLDVNVSGLIYGAIQANGQGANGQIPVSNGSYSVWTNPGDIPSLASAIATAVNTWLTANITNPSSPPLDRSLTQSTAAAPADMVGELKKAFEYKNEGYYYFSLISDKYISRDNGAEVSYAGWSATDYVPVPNNCLIIAITSVTLAWGARYDSNKNYVEAYGWTNGASYFNSTGDMVYFRISGSNSDMAGLKFQIMPCVDKTLTKNGYPADAKTVGDRLNALVNDRAIPSYYETQISTKEATIRALHDDCAFNGDGLVFITDTHFSSDLFTSDTPTNYFNANNSFSLIKHIMKYTGIEMICFGGDLVNSTSDVDTMLLSMSVFCSMFDDNKYRLRYCVGNHEYFTGADYGLTTKPTPNELYGACPKFNENNYLGKGEQSSYFFDNTLQKIRYFVISCGRNTELTLAQVAWVLSEFKNVPSDYKIVCIGHAFINDAMNAFRGYHANIMAALDAVKACTTYTFNGVTYDYTTLNNVEVVCAITGHTHIDGSLTTTGGILCICTTTDSYANNYELVNGVPTLVPRTQGTTDEQAFDVIQFDFTGRKIYCTRIGYGSDRDFSF